jgi:mannose/fructose-specific phosphotransferase system component IIA
MKTYKALIIALVFVFGLLMIGQRQLLWNPMVRGNSSGIRFQQTVYLGSPTADVWVWGDTSAAGMCVPEQPMELIDVKIFADPDSADSCRVIVYGAAAGTGTAETICSTDTLVGTTFAKAHNQTISSTYKTVTATEGYGVLFDFIAGTPNNVTVQLEWKTRLQDAYE